MSKLLTKQEVHLLMPLNENNKVMGFLKRVQGRLIKTFLGNIKYGKFVGVEIGENCEFHSSNFGSEPYLVKIGNHVQVAGDVHFWTHGGSWVLREDEPLHDYFGRIEVGNNVYIGAGTGILPGVVISNNVIIAARSVVTKSIPEGSIVAGNPAKIVASLEEFKEKMQVFNTNLYKLPPEKKKERILKLGEDKFVKKEWLKRKS